MFRAGQFQNRARTREGGVDRFHRMRYHLFGCGLRGAVNQEGDGAIRFQRLRNISGQQDQIAAFEQIAVNRICAITRRDSA